MKAIGWVLFLLGTLVASAYSAAPFQLSDSAASSASAAAKTPNPGLADGEQSSVELDSPGGGAEASPPKPTSEQRLRAWAQHSGLPFGAGLTLMLGGVFLVRFSMGKENVVTSGEAHESGADRVLASLVTNFEKIDFSVVDDSTRPRLSAEISALFDDDASEFVLQRAELTRRLGQVGYAKLMSDFSEFERLLARAWSALIDGAYQEVQPSRERARRALERTAAVLAEHPAKV